MLTIKDIEEATFRKSNMKGYRTDDVDDFLDEVKDSFEKLLAENSVLKGKLSEALEKNRVLTSDMTAMKTKMEDVRTDGDEIKNALISAHKLADVTVRNAQTRADEIVAQAQKKVDDILGGLDDQVVAKKNELETARQMVSDFRSEIFAMYKEHIEMINHIPEYTPPTPPVEAPADAPAETAPTEETPSQPEAMDQTRVVPDLKEFSSEKAEEPAEEPEPQEKPEPDEAKEDSSFDFTNFMVDSSDYRPKRRESLKFGDGYDISKDK